MDRTRDGVLVCMHDGTVDRTTDGTGQTGDLTLAELKQLDCGSWFDPAFAGARVPTIAEVLALAGRQPTPAGVEPPLLAVDIKAGEEGGALERELVQLALGHGVLAQCLLEVVFGKRYPHLRRFPTELSCGCVQQLYLADKLVRRARRQQRAKRSAMAAAQTLFSMSGSGAPLEGERDFSSNREFAMYLDSLM